MSSINKGNKLEDDFYNYLLEQKDKQDYVFGIYPPELCKIHKKKKYYCDERKGDVEFDIAVEVSREGANNPHLIVIFECKNHSNNISENLVTDFSDKLNRMFKHKAKGILVVSTPLQSGAQNIVESRKIGLVKYDGTGFEIVIERTVEEKFLKHGIFNEANKIKPLKFSSYYQGQFFSSTKDLFKSLESNDINKNVVESTTFSIPYLSSEDIGMSVKGLLAEVKYEGGRVDLENICSFLKLKLNCHEERQHDNNGREILGFADFSKREININLHENKHRERFTIGHEIGHFYLGHDKFLKSEHLIESDLLKRDIQNNGPPYERLEAQANIFSSQLLLPESHFLKKTEELRKDLDIRDKGNGYIYVDDQPCNYSAYNSLLSGLSLHFGASKNAVEVKLKNLHLLKDGRKKFNQIHTSMGHKD